MKVPEEARKCVCFIAVPTYGTNGRIRSIDKLIGTAFIVGVSSKLLSGISYCLPYER